MLRCTGLQARGLQCAVRAQNACCAVPALWAIQEATTLCPAPACCAGRTSSDGHHHASPACISHLLVRWHVASAGGSVVVTTLQHPGAPGTVTHDERHALRPQTAVRSCPGLRVYLRVCAPACSLSHCFVPDRAIAGQHAWGGRQSCSPSASHTAWATSQQVWACVQAQPICADGPLSLACACAGQLQGLVKPQSRSFNEVVWQQVGRARCASWPAAPPLWRPSVLASRLCAMHGCRSSGGPRKKAATMMPVNTPKASAALHRGAQLSQRQPCWPAGPCAPSRATAV
jgi:hypothetical protein